jgi:hypothetical protein
MATRLDRQRQPGHYHVRRNSRLYRRGYTDLPHAVWGDRFGPAAPPVDPGPFPPASAVPLGTWDWSNGTVLEADVNVAFMPPETTVSIHAIDVPDVDHTALFDQVAPGWWIYVSVPGVRNLRVKLDYAFFEAGAGHYIFGGDNADDDGGGVPNEDDDTSVWLQRPDGSFPTTAELDAHVLHPGNYTILEIQEWLDDHPILVLAQALRNNEAARPTPRVTLLDWVDGFIESLDGIDP